MCSCIMPPHRHSRYYIWIFVVPISGGCVDDLLRTDLGVLLDGDVLVGLEG
jgi:hypothetical protein